MFSVYTQGTFNHQLLIGRNNKIDIVQVKRKTKNTEILKQYDNSLLSFCKRRYTKGDKKGGTEAHFPSI